MKKRSIKINAFFTAAILLLVQTFAFAQEKIEIDKEDVGNWFSRNWMWVAGGVLLLLILLLASGGSSRRAKSKTTTIIKDNAGNVKKVTTTEVED